MFKNDYSEICAKEVLDAIALSLDEQNVGYGMDKYSQEAKNIILKEFGLNDKSDVHFLVGGTQANTVALSYFLKPYEGIIACDTAHINVHETGSVEGTGHKIYISPNQDGKLTPADIDKAMAIHKDCHMVKLSVVYISNSTEIGTIYTKKELQELRKACDKYGLLLYMDGARLGIALTAPNNDVTPKDIADNCDIFYVGGTKNGAMYGEAVVIKDKKIAPDFRYHIKNRCAMVAKGYILGIQFKALFTEGLYYKLASHANEMASLIRNGLTGYVEFVGSSTTNQIFIRVTKELGLKLVDKYGVEIWEDLDKDLCVRIVTSFASKEADCRELVEYVRNSK